jgi:anti-sigma28 factor (negative regulator of flagellin synthesis)
MIINNNDTPDVSRLNLDQANLNKTQGSSRAASASYSATTTGSATTTNAPGGDSISLSNSPNLVQQALSSSSAERTARTQELKALVQNNQYYPDAQEVSSALIDAHLTGA